MQKSVSNVAHLVVNDVIVRVAEATGWRRGVFIVSGRAGSTHRHHVTAIGSLRISLMVILDVNWSRHVRVIHWRGR